MIDLLSKLSNLTSCHVEHQKLNSDDGIESPEPLQPRPSIHIHLAQKIYTTSMHSSRICTARFSGHGGSLFGGFCSVGYLPIRIPPEGTWDQAARQEVTGTRQPDKKWNHTEPPLSPVDRMTDTCKNITLPQTSFAGGDNQCSPRTIYLHGQCTDVRFLRQFLVERDRL